jgi:hypothetical protein
MSHWQNNLTIVTAIVKDMIIRIIIQWVTYTKITRKSEIIKKKAGKKKLYVF